MTVADLKRQLATAREALTELVACKDLKERIEWLEKAATRGRLTDNESEELKDSIAEYARRKPLAWQAARQCARPLPTDGEAG